jgi:TRAP-type mannitol/chloroaromatic compound transport system permease large subunit
MPVAIALGGGVCRPCHAQWLTQSLLVQKGAAYLASAAICPVPLFVLMGAIAAHSGMARTV